MNRIRRLRILATWIGSLREAHVIEVRRAGIGMVAGRCSCGWHGKRVPKSATYTAGLEAGRTRRGRERGDGDDRRAEENDEQGVSEAST